MYKYEKCVEINNSMQKYLQGKDLNFSKFIVPAKEGEVTIIGKYAQKHYGDYKNALGDGFCRLIVENNQLKVVQSQDYDGFYYGISPRFNNSMIMDELSKFSLKNKEGLEKFVAEHADLFMLHKGQEKYLAAMAKYFTLCMFYNFGMKISLRDKTETDAFVKLFGDKHPYFKIKDNVLIIHGCPTEAVLDFLISHGYMERDYDSKGSSECEFGLVNGDVFYSGVLLRPVHIEERNVWNSNSNISAMCIYYERSTYGTVFSLDNNLTEHPLLTAEEKELISEFFKTDDECKIKYLCHPVENGEAGRTKTIAQINAYLKDSYNVNQIGITGNIITADQVLIYGKRSPSSIDSGKLYPSVNGNAEIADLDVEFYSDSAEVDFPQMSVESMPFRFGKELCRETEAELNLSLSNNLWKCYGLALSGIVPAEAGEGARRRMHFNVIFKQSINQTFEEIREMQKTAVENYENGELHGVKIKIFENRAQWLRSIMKNVLQLVIDSRDIIGSVLTVLLFYLSMANLENTLDGLNTAISAFFAVLVLLTTVSSVIKRIKVYFQRKKYLHNVIIVNNTKDIENKLNKAGDAIMMKHECHPVTYLAIRLHLMELVTK